MLVYIMSAGRPHKSTTPIWRNKAVIKVGIYRFLEGEQATKVGCARYMNMSRTTVIKWWDSMEWTEEKRCNFKKVIDWYVEYYYTSDLGACSIDLNIPIVDVFLYIALWQEMVPKYYL